MAKKGWMGATGVYRPKDKQIAFRSAGKAKNGGRAPCNASCQGAEPPLCFPFAMKKGTLIRAIATLALLGAWVLVGCTQTTTTTHPVLYRSTSPSRPDPVSPIEKNYNNFNNKAQDVLFGPE
jgi:hypothetical protein